MKIDRRNTNQGSVLIVAILSITILMLICATSLYVTSQNATSNMQTASWQQSLTAAEGGVDAAIRALNNKTWTNWISVDQTGTSLPTAEPAPSPSPAASAAPDSSHYNYLPSSALTVTMQGEGATGVSAWVTVDQAGMSTGQDTNGLQWYRIRSTGVAAAPGPARISNRAHHKIYETKISHRWLVRLRSNRTIAPQRLSLLAEACHLTIEKV
jgi:hypothetical protein